LSKCKDTTTDQVCQKQKDLQNQAYNVS